MNKKVHRAFRLDEIVLTRIKDLQEYYSNQLDIRVSQADIIKIAINSEYESAGLSSDSIDLKSHFNTSK